MNLIPSFQHFRTRASYLSPVPASFSSESFPCRGDESVCPIRPLNSPSKGSSQVAVVTLRFLGLTTWLDS